MDKSGFKAIETRYDGHLFRSRIEARWAVFFNELGIEYHYEPEGYELEGIRYLPDFYLPKQDCFVEIKGQRSTREEERKVKLLSFYTGKRAFLFSGEISSIDPCDPSNIGYLPAFIKTIFADEKRVPECIQVPLHILTTAQKLYDGGYTFLVEENWCQFTREKTGYMEHKKPQGRFEYSLDEILADIAESYHAGFQGIELFKTHQEEIYQFFQTPKDCYRQFIPQCSLYAPCWKECQRCHAFDIADFYEPEKYDCMCSSGDERLIPFSDQISEAYDAATSARFEFGWKGRTK